MSEAVVQPRGGAGDDDRERQGGPEVVDAVIISGPRRGEIIHLRPDQEETWTSEDLDRLLAALQELDQAFCGLVESTRRLERTAETMVESF